MMKFLVGSCEQRPILIRSGTVLRSSAVPISTRCVPLHWPACGAAQTLKLWYFQQGLKKCIFPSKVVRFPTISYVFLYLKNQNFPPNG